jgi:hypothetical protein
MGLDMYLSGRKFLQGYRMPKLREEDGFEVEEIVVKLGYWRKHPDLHGYIVQHFGPLPRDVDGREVEDGERLDDCSDINLDMANLQQIIEAVKNDELPTTQGFFFGTSHKLEDIQLYQQQKDEDLEMLGHAVAWLSLLDANADYCWRSVVYRASW